MINKLLIELSGVVKYLGKLSNFHKKNFISSTTTNHFIMLLTQPTIAEANQWRKRHVYFYCF